MNRSIKVNFTSILWFCILMCLMKPDGLVTVLNIRWYANWAQFICFVLSALLWVKKMSMAKSTLCYIVFFVWLTILSCLLNVSHDDFMECLRVSYANIGTVLFLNYATKKNTKRIIKVCFLIYLVLVSLNLGAMILFPRGLFNFEVMELHERGYWLFGHVNSTITYTLPAIVVSYIYIERYHHVFLGTLGIVVSVFSVFYSKSSTSIVGVVVFFLVTIVYRQLSNINIYLNSYIGIIIGSIGSISISVLHIYNMLVPIVVGIFHKEMTFTGRADIWKLSLGYIRKNIIYGYGYHRNTFWQMAIKGSSSHNEILYTLIQGGIILLVIFYFIFIFSATEVGKTKNSKIYILYNALIFSLFIMFITETHMHRIPMLIFLIGNLPSLLGNAENQAYRRRNDEII